MRRRSAALLSTALLSALALAGCSAQPDPEASPTGTPGDLCAAVGDSGPAVEALTVSDAGIDQGPVPIEFTAPLEVDEFQREVVIEGDGEQIEAGQFVELAFVGYNAETGELLGTNGYEPGQMLPEQISPDSIYAPVLGCATVGSRIAAAYTGATGQDGTQVPAAVYAFDVLGITPTAAWGEPQEPAEGMPEVELAEDGTPSVTIPDGMTAPETTEAATLKLGDGIEVADGDRVLVQHAGFKLSDGSEFDSSWANGQPIDFETSGVVEGFQKALVGQTVGSQVIAVVPPAEGYGQPGYEDHELHEESLVFVVDILATQHLTQQ